MEEVDEVELVVQRVAALDLGKATLEACMRVPHSSKPGRRMQEIRPYATTTAALLEMAIWLRQWGVERVVMESTSDYWKEGRLLPVGVRGVRLLAGQRPRGQERAGAGQDGSR